jgi:hypothetical protein
MNDKRTAFLTDETIEAMSDDQVRALVEAYASENPSFVSKLSLLTFYHHRLILRAIVARLQDMMGDAIGQDRPWRVGQGRPWRAGR